MTIPTLSPQAALPTRPGVGLALLRVVLGTIFVYHGAGKLFGDLAQTAGFFGSLGIPAPTLSAWLVALVEFGGGLALLLGVFARPAAVLLIPVMVVAVLTVHGAHGFENTNIVGMGEAGPVFGMPGWEYNLTLIGGLLAVLFGGAGRWALGKGGAISRQYEVGPAHA
jgi:putative oxidoreductase